LVLFDRSHITKIKACGHVEKRVLGGFFEQVERENREKPVLRKNPGGNFSVAALN
jgi:hypothetical protein